MLHKFRAPFFFLFLFYSTHSYAQNILIDFYNPQYQELIPLYTDSFYFKSESQERFLRFKPLLSGQQTPDFIDETHFLLNGFFTITERFSEATPYGALFNFSDYNSIIGTTEYTRSKRYGINDRMYDSVFYDYKINNEWVPTQKTYQEFGPGNKLTRYHSYFWNNSNQNWSPSNQTLYEYDPLFREISRINYSWNGAWYATYKSLKTYSGTFQKPVSEMTAYLSGQVFVPSDSTYFWLDAAGDRDSSVTFSWVPALNIWAETYRVLYENEDQEKTLRGRTIIVQANGTRFEKENWVFLPGDMIYTNEPGEMIEQTNFGIGLVDKEKTSLVYGPLINNQIKGTRTTQAFNFNTGLWEQKLLMEAWFREKTDVSTIEPRIIPQHCGIPNPVSAQNGLQLPLKPNEDATEIKVYKFDGQLISQKTDSSPLVTSMNLPTGIYALSIWQSGVPTCVQKIIVQN